MKILILLLCILNGASFYPMKDSRVNIFEYFQRNDTSPQNIDINYLLKNLVNPNPVSRSNDDESTRERDPLEVISRQRRSSSSNSTEKSNCKYVEFYIDLGDIFYPPKLNIGACVGGPLIFNDMDTSHYMKFLQQQLKYKSDKNSAAKHPLLQFKQGNKSDANDLLSYDIVPGCKATLKSAEVILYDKIKHIMTVVNIPDMVIDSCT